MLELLRTYISLLTNLFSAAVFQGSHFHRSRLSYHRRATVSNSTKL